MKRMLVAVAFALAPLSGCATHPYDGELRAAMDAPYQLSSGDRLRVIVFGQDNLTNSFSVDGAGNIAMPLIGLVHAQGLTTAQLAGHVEARLREGYLREPKVSVEVEAYRPFFRAGRSQHFRAISLYQRHDGADGGGGGGRFLAARRPVRRRRDARARRQARTTASVPMTFPVRPATP